MNTPLVTASRDALAKVLRVTDLASHIRDARSVEVPCEHWIDPGIAVCSPCLRDRITPHIIDALLASGVVRAAEEPTGLGAVVEDEAGDRWTRADHGTLPWFRTERGGNGGACEWRNFHDIDAVRVLSEGVTQ